MSFDTTFDVTAVAFFFTYIIRDLSARKHTDRGIRYPSGLKDLQHTMESGLYLL